ncbi:unnamed protein product [Discosporangium mesarthrocarpum]
MISALKAQIDDLKRVSYSQYLGIKVSVENATHGFASNEEVRIRLIIPYCRITLEWELIFDEDAPERCPDLVPLPSSDADSSEGFSPQMQNIYDTYRMSKLPSLAKWDLFRRSSSLTSLALDLKRLRRCVLLLRLRRTVFRGAAFNFEVVKGREDEVDVIVTRTGVRMEFPLWEDCCDEDPVFLYGRGGLRLRVDWSEVGGGEKPDIRVDFAQGMEALSIGFRQPVWTSEMTLYDYIPQVQEAVAVPWRMRRKLVSALADRYAVLEYDALGFTAIHLFVKVMVGKLIHLHILRVDINPGFPEERPTMTLMDALKGQSWPLDRQGYRYSPRWDVDRMAQEIFAYAESKMPEMNARGGGG